MSINALYPVNRIKRGTNSELASLLREVLNVEVLPDALNRNNVLILLHICSYLSASDLSYYFGLPDGNFKSLHSLLNAMEKSGLIKSTTVGMKDGFSKNVYYPTELGFLNAGSMFMNGSQIPYKRRGKSVTTLHDYSIGQNALHLILFNMPFTWSKERSYSVANNNRKAMGSLCIDGVCDFIDTSHTLFFEEDLANESIGTLYKKLEKYHFYELMDTPEKNTLIFSFRKPSLTCDAPAYPAFSTKRLEELADFMESNQILFIQDAIFILTAEGNETLLGVAEHISTLYSVHYPSKQVDLTEVRAFLKDFSELKLDLRHMEYNSMQLSFAISRSRSLLGMFVKVYNGPEYTYPSFFHSFMKGFSVYGLPTTLLSNFLPYINFTQTGLHYSFPMLLSSFYPGMDAMSYQSVMNTPLKMATGSRQSLALKNAFSFQKGTVCMEYVSHDLAAVLRVMRFKDCYLDSDVYVICMVDSYKDALFLANDAFLSCKTNENVSLPKIVFLDLSEVPKGIVHPFIIGTDLKKIFI